MEVSAPTFDLETWLTNYEGALVPYRLTHIALRCPSISRQSLSLAISTTKDGMNTQLYTRLCTLATGKGFQDLGTIDEEWVAKQDEANKRELSRLEGELRGYKNNLIRESIRMGMDDMAMHCLNTGGPPLDPGNPATVHPAGYNAAHHAVAKLREYCNTPGHVANMTLRSIYINFVHAIALQQKGQSATIQFSSINGSAQKLLGLGSKDDPEARKLQPIANVCRALANLGMGSYKETIFVLLQTAIEYKDLGSVYTMDFARLIASPNDVAIYGGLCALATLPRQELIDVVLGGPFRAFLELEPHMRKAISLFTTAKYQQCLALLRHYYSDWSLDIFLGAHDSSNSTPHLDRLFARIREKSITAYFSAFSEVSIASLAATFPPQNANAANTAEAMEDEMLALIDAGLLPARLDAVAGVLIAPQKDLRADAHRDARAAADEIERSLLLRLHRVNVTLAGVEIVKAAPQQVSMKPKPVAEWD